MILATQNRHSVGALVGRVCRNAAARGLHYGTTYRVCHDTVKAWLLLTPDSPLYDNLLSALVSQLANAHTITVKEARELINGS